MNAPLFRRRTLAGSALPASLHPVLQRVYAARGIVDAAELDLAFGGLLPPETMRGIEAAAEVLCEAIEAGRCIVIAGDYDADGATATAVAMLGLQRLGAVRVDYVVPNRFTMGYGLSPALVDLARTHGAEVIVTVDNGIASLAGVAHAKALGLRVVVTDHHLAGPQLPDADAIVDPNQPGCAFPSKSLAGVGVMFYVLLALRARLRERGAFTAKPEPNLAALLDLVALGTVADLARLDRNNRILVEQGLKRIRAGRARPGLLALLECAGRPLPTVGAADLGFALGPRLNAAGRLDDMGAGIECLLTEDREQARVAARRLDALNRERRGIEAEMRELALERVAGLDHVGIVLFDADWHEGVVGLVASRVKDHRHRPSIAFARAHTPGLLKGSGRSIAGLHLRDALAAIDAAQPGLIERFGGHAMAAGLTLEERKLEAFSAAFDACCRAALDEAALLQIHETDGELTPDELVLETALAIEDGGPWGQGFPEPLFEGRFEIREARPLGAEGKHMRYRFGCGRVAIDAVHFGGGEQRVERGSVGALYKLAVSRWRGEPVAELRIEQLWPA